jgi:hypothetical protein
VRCTPGSSQFPKENLINATYMDGNSPGQLAQHESGHAAGFWSQGIPLDYVTIVGHESQPRPHTQPVDVTSGTRGQKILISTSGVIAGFWFNGQIMSDNGIAELLTGSADDRFELVGMFSGQKTRLPRVPFIAPGEDLHRISPESLEHPFTAEHAVILWRHCERFVASVLPAIDAIAGKLVSRRHLDGDEAARLAATAMVGRPAPWIPAWTAED